MLPLNKERTMTLKMTQAPPVPGETYALPALPTFPLEAGFRQIYDPETGVSQHLPLTLLDFLYPSDEDVGVVIMPETPLHDIWTNLLAIMLRSYLAVENWLVLSDVLIHWGRRGAPAKAPDLAAIPGGRMPEPRQKSYRVGRHGPVPVFALELTSSETRLVDLQEKPLLYAAVGIKEFLIIDLLPEGKGAWQLTGYRLEDEPFYHKLQPDAEGGLTFETIGLRFVAIGQERIEVYDAATGERLLTPTELKARAEAEAAGRVAAEARAEELASRLRELEARYGVQVADEPPVEPQDP
jgi:Uma2 family endonuclease